MEATLSAPSASSPALTSYERAGKYLTFVIGKEEFGVAVREIMGIQDITASRKHRPISRASSSAREGDPGH